MKFTALSSQLTFPLFSEKTFFEKMKIGQLFLSIFEIFKIESQTKNYSFNNYSLIPELLLICSITLLIVVSCGTRGNILRCIERHFCEKTVSLSLYSS